MIQSQTAPPVLPGYNSILDKVLSLDRLRDLYQVAARTETFHQNLLAHLDIDLSLSDADLARIPRTGSLIVVANHPFGMLEGSILGTIFSRVRPDYKIVTNRLLSTLPALESECIFVDPFGDKTSTSRNSSALREALRWVRDGHMLVVFPAGEVSHWNMRERSVQDPDWNHIAARLIRKTGSAALPMYFKGINSVPFHLLGMVHPRLRTARLPHELFNKRGQTFEVCVGSVISSSKLGTLLDDAEITAYLRGRTYLLGKRGDQCVPANVAARKDEPIAPAGPTEALLAELRALRPEQHLDESPEFSVHIAGAQQIPNLLRELGRLREISFRQVGEGTGKSCDRDRFDDYYEHLILWNKTDGQIAGAYRIGNAKRIISEHGVDGLYSSTLFQYDAAFLGEIGPALELGRSFIRAEYQKQYAPLLLLWKGLGRYVSQHPETPTLFGAVSISSRYSSTSRELIARFLQERQANGTLAKMVRARRPLPRRTKLDINDQAICSFFHDLDSLSEIVESVEADGKGIPVLLRQYLKLGGKILGFNVDPNFADALDGLVVVDLRETERNVLDRYMGKTGAELFLASAGQTATARTPLFQ